MIQIAQLARSTIDRWPIEASGLSLRIRHSLDRAGMTSVGELRRLKRADVQKLPHLGRRSHAQIRRFLSMCGRMERGTLAFRSIQTVLRSILKPAQLGVLSARYG